MAVSACATLFPASATWASDSNQNPQTEITESHISVRLKHGIHTIYLFVDASDSMRAVNDELLLLLRERYPGGLIKSLDAPDTTPIPAENDNVTIAYAVLTIPNDPTRGWKRLRINDEEVITAAKAGLKDNGIVAFTFVPVDEDEDEDPLFEVEWPKDDEEMYE